MPFQDLSFPRIIGDFLGFLAILGGALVRSKILTYRLREYYDFLENLSRVSTATLTVAFLNQDSSGLGTSTDKTNTRIDKIQNGSFWWANGHRNYYSPLDFIWWINESILTLEWVQRHLHISCRVQSEPRRPRRVLDQVRLRNARPHTKSVQHRTCYKFTKENKTGKKKFHFSNSFSERKKDGNNQINKSINSFK